MQLLQSRALPLGYPAAGRERVEKPALRASESLEGNNIFQPQTKSASGENPSRAQVQPGVVAARPTRYSAAMTQPVLIALATMLPLFFALLLLGRWLKRGCGVRLGVMYQIFALVTAAFVPLKFLEVHVELLRALGSAVVIFGTFFFLALLRRFYWEYYFQHRHQAEVPKFISQVVALAVMLAAIILVLDFVYGLRVPGLLAGSGILAVILGLAMQDLLGNIIAGFALNIGRPFRAGDWLVLDKYQAEVMETNWRSTRLRTNDHLLLDIPNNQIARQIVVNLGPATHPHAMRLHVNLDYAAAPNPVKAAILHAASRAEGVLAEPKPKVFLVAFADSAITYEIKFWLLDHQRFNEISDAIKTNLWYELKRAGIKIPFPIRTVQLERGSAGGDQTGSLAAILARQSVFACLDAAQLESLLAHAQPKRFGRGERIIEQGGDGASMFILVRGAAGVVIGRDGSPTRVATLRDGQCFGEMSLLTGENRSATIIAEEECEVVEIDKESLAQLLKESPKLLEQLSELLARRHLESEGALALATPAAESARHREYAAGLLARLTSFFEL